MTLDILNFRKAVKSDAEEIARLVNLAYRGDSSREGWTTEADILDGLRTSSEEIVRLIEAKNTIILVCLKDKELIASVCLEYANSIVDVGMFVVKPSIQGMGLGKQLLDKAENMAQHVWLADRFQMHVITIRHELIAFYERRGYLRTGNVSDFPVKPEVWQPKLEALQLEVLEKVVPKL